MKISVFRKLLYLFQNRGCIKQMQTAGGYSFGTEIVMSLPSLNSKLGSEEISGIVSESASCGPVTAHLPFYGLDFSCPDEHIAEYSRSVVKQAVDLCHKAGISKGVCHTGFSPLLPEKAIYKWFDLFFEAKKEIEDYAGKRDVSVLWENTHETHIDVFREIIKENPETLICLDTGHVNCFADFSMKEFTEEFSDSIVHAHIHDNNGKEDSHSALGSGNMDFKEISELLNSTNAEVCVCELYDDDLKHSMPVLKKYFFETL
ncbi:MAG: sugar phosphate isomerase/epimerase family protein [bacterium]